MSDTRKAAKQSWFSKMMYGKKGKRKTGRQIMNEQKEGVQKHGNRSIFSKVSGPESGEEQGRRAYLQAKERERRSRNKR